MTDLYELGGQEYGSGRRKLIVNLAPVRQNLCIPKTVINRSAPSFRLALPSALFWQLVFFHFSLGKKHTYVCSSLVAQRSALVIFCSPFVCPFLTERSACCGALGSLGYIANAQHHISLSNRGVCKAGYLHMPIVTVHFRSTQIHSVIGEK